MSELKSETIYFTHENGDAYAVDMYLKSDADKVITHQKYKRCIGLWARLEMNCNWFENRLHNAIELGVDSDVKRWTRKLHHAKRWRNRWLELAEKFKEGV